MRRLATLLFWVLAILTGLCAIAVVVTQNIVRAAAWLLFTLAGTAGIFFLLGADFVGATQLLVYVGGTLVLVVFGVMLTAQGPFINMKTGAAEWAIAAGRRPAALRRARRQRRSPATWPDTSRPRWACPDDLARAVSTLARGASCGLTAGDPEGRAHRRARAADSRRERDGLPAAL